MAYSVERKAAVLKKMLPPNNVPLRQLSREEGICEATLHSWRKEARGRGQLLPDANAGPEGWSSRDKFAAVVETVAMSASDLAEYCRQRVSNDNPFSEALFRTCESRPEWPSKGFTDIEAARERVKRFGTWYNGEHLHSAIRFVTPNTRHTRQDPAVLAQRASLWAKARAARPERWSGQPRNWAPVGDVWLNPERDSGAPKIRDAA